MRVLGISGLDATVEFKKERFPDLGRREYRIAQGFDSAAALVNGGAVVAAAAEERFSREKGTHRFPARAMQYCLDVGGLSPSDLDFVAHGFDYGAVAEHYQGDEFARDRYQRVYAPDVQRRALEAHFPGVDWSSTFVPVPHHLAHAASTFYPSGFDDALILITDGMGEIHSMTALIGSPSGMEVIRQIPALHSLGVMYGVFTLYLGFYLGLDEYKVMGLAPYGNPRKYFDRIMKYVSLKDDGTYTIPLLAENRTTVEKETHRGVLTVLEREFGPQRDPESDITQDHKDLAAGLQAVLQACQLHVLRCLKQETGLKNLCMAGGVALNCTANGVIRRSRLFENMFVQPAAGDDGSALGAAMYVERERESEKRTTTITVPLWGPEFDESDYRAAVNGRGDCEVIEFGTDDGLIREVARRLADGQIVAWFQGRMEFGPRALGSRSILADPRGSDMRDRINALVKKREGFRPFAPAVTVQAASTYFEIAVGDEPMDAHMLYVSPVRRAYRPQLPAVTHVDGSARVQTVVREHNPKFWTLLNAFGEITGMPVLLNTSFNVRGQPIVCTPTEAVDTFLFASLDALVLGDVLVVPAAVVEEGGPEQSVVQSTT